MRVTVGSIEYTGRAHINGGGFVRDDVTVPDSVHIGKYAIILGGTIRGGTIEGGTIWGGTIEGGTIRGGTIKRDVTHIVGCTPYPVTITNDHCGVGCEWHSHDYWLRHGREIMNRENPNYGDKYMPILETMIHLHQEGK